MNRFDRSLVELRAKAFLQQMDIRVGQNCRSRRREPLGPQTFAPGMGCFGLWLPHVDRYGQRLRKVAAQLLLNTLHMRIVEEGGMAAIERSEEHTSELQ